MSIAIDLSTPPVLDVEELLLPISEDSPAGVSLRYEPEYDAIRDARRSEDDAPQGDWQRATKVADWDEVVEVGTRALRSRTKDLQIAAWITEALTHLHGFAGLRDGLRLMNGIQEAFWESYYPEVEDGDLESRTGPFLFLNDPRLLPLLIRNVPLTDADERYGFLKYNESREVENAILKDPDDEGRILADGKIRAERFDQMVAATPRRFFERVSADLHGAREAFRAFDRGTDERFGRDAPSLINIGRAIDDCLRLVDSILPKKRQAEPDPELDAPRPTAGEGPDAGEADGDGDGVAVNGRASAAGLEAGLADFGQVLIQFHDRAQELADAGNRLKENRARYAELQAQLRELDQEYSEIASRISHDREFYHLLGRLLGRTAP